MRCLYLRRNERFAAAVFPSTCDFASAVAALERSMPRGAYAYRDLDEEVFAPPECTSFYESHASPQVQKGSAPQSSSKPKQSESAILRRHLALRRNQRNKLVLATGALVMFVSAVLLLTLSKLPAPEKSSLELIVGAPYSALRGGSAVARVPVDHDEEAEAAWAANAGPNAMAVNVGDNDPFDINDSETVATDDIIQYSPVLDPADPENDGHQ